MKAKSSHVNEKVMKVAAKKIFESGAKGWNMDQLAAESGITKRTLYKIIPSKEKLIEGIVMDIIQNIQADISKIIEQGGEYTSVIERIIASNPLFMDKMFSKTMQDIILEYPAIEKRLYMSRAELTERLVSFIQAGIEKGYLRHDLDPNLILELFQAVLFYFVRFNPKDGDYSNKMRAAFNCILQGIVQKH
jgi:AcrR family transcriptional regulator